MRLDQSASEIIYLIRKIEDGSLDMQPNFQRGAVWTDGKKQRLIDSILREWYIPAIHIVVNDDLDREEVLDGQQRLRSIVDFMRGEFRVDGRIAPRDNHIEELDGLYYQDLPVRVRARFDRFPLTTIRLRDYGPGEPGELFFRLNQLTSLTSAEQRNALFGAPRDQIRALAELLAEVTEDTGIGFSNTRMNHDDVLSRLVVSLESGGLQEKITASSLEARYRTGAGFPARVLQSSRTGIRRLGSALRTIAWPIRFNKATMFSWLYFVASKEWEDNREIDDAFATFLLSFENARSMIKGSQHLDRIDFEDDNQLLRDPCGLIHLFNDRSTSRVNDVSSVMLRDFSLCASCYWYGPRILREVIRSGPLVVFPNSLKRELEESYDAERESIIEQFLLSHPNRPLS